MNTLEARWAGRNKRRFVVAAVSSLFLAFSFFFAGCGGGGGASSGTGGTSSGSNTNNSSGGVSSSATISGMLNAASGISVSEIANATVYVMGQEANKTTTDANGNYTLTVDISKISVVTQKPFFLDSVFSAVKDAITKAPTTATNQYHVVAQSASMLYGKKFEVTLNQGDAVTGQLTSLEKVGSITGNAVLQGQSDHTGIMVYIPGTSFLALTDANGNYTISNVPPGTYPFLRAEKSGYHYAMLSNVTVNTNAATAAENMTLLLDTGASGTLVIGTGASVLRSMTATLSIGATSSAVLMKISEDVNFIGASWEPLQTTKAYTFASNGAKTLYIKFADANGLESSPFTASVQVVTASVTKIEASNHSVVLKSDGTLWAWGDAQLGGICNGATTGYATGPLQVGTGTNWVAIGAGGFRTYAIKTDGTLWGCGENSAGQLGDGTTTDRSTPIQIGTATNWSSISVGGWHTIGLKTDGTLWAWGANALGQLGDGTVVDKTTPIQIGVDTNWKAIAAGLDYTVALKTDGTLWAWGVNGNGQLGDGTTLGSGTMVSKNAPTQIGTGTNWAVVAAGSTHTVAIKTDGTLWAWGYNNKGQLGDGTTVDKLAPTQIGVDTNWASVSAGNDQWGGYTIATKTDGTLWAWGNNAYGQLGDGTTTDKTTSTQIGVDTTWAAIVAGGLVSGGHVLGIKSDGSLWAWGRNDMGQLGDGTSVEKLVPTLIMP